jgi:hypothetical protein
LISGQMGRTVIKTVIFDVRSNCVSIIFLYLEFNAGRIVHKSDWQSAWYEPVIYVGTEIAPERIVYEPSSTSANPFFQR